MVEQETFGTTLVEVRRSLFEKGIDCKLKLEFFQLQRTE
jgi:hypothetical protein